MPDERGYLTDDEIEELDLDTLGVVEFADDVSRPERDAVYERLNEGSIPAVRITRIQAQRLIERREQEASQNE